MYNIDELMKKQKKTPRPPDVSVEKSPHRCVGHSLYYIHNRYPWSDYHWSQCVKRNGHGPGGRYCRHHAWHQHNWKPTFWLVVIWRRLMGVDKGIETS